MKYARKMVQANDSQQLVQQQLKRGVGAASFVDAASSQYQSMIASNYLTPGDQMSNSVHLNARLLGDGGVAPATKNSSVVAGNPGFGNGAGTSLQMALNSSATAEQRSDGMIMSRPLQGQVKSIYSKISNQLPHQQQQQASSAAYAARQASKQRSSIEVDMHVMAKQKQGFNVQSLLLPNGRDADEA